MVRYISHQVMSAAKKYTIWDFPSRWEDYQLPRFVMIDACKKNDLTTVMKLINETEWTPFELMIMTIYGNERGDQVFSFLLSRLSHQDMTKTFFYYNQDIEHTLLTLYCSLIFYREKLENVQSKMIRLIQAGSQLDQEIGIERKTALSFMVTKEFNLSILKWSIETIGADPRKGHLLHYACNSISKDDHEARIVAEQFYAETLNGPNSPMAEPDEISDCKPYDNLPLYQYLLSLGLDVEECIAETGLTPLLSVCSEGNPDKVRVFLQVGGANVSLYRKTKEGLDVWFWAEQYKYENWDEGYMYPLRDVLVAYKEEQKLYWKDMMEEVMGQPSLLQDVQVCHMLEVVS
jgi:hypothetical protein